ncbi:hypothetical protein PoB_001730100 [Plakobranchus ocellatus]|uniref:Uncharacterized protein n=1 Tax=Plakobranchus ocellatus TaxID=259542 RepID=A0AAV3Z4K4_9GAST|nr:hypothetical protein PoB_001730100 [Plakobranchus ocellatus]
MECDSMQCYAERRLNRLFLFIPHDHVLAVQMARQVSSPYHVREVLFRDSFKLSAPCLKAVHLRRICDPTVSDVCCFTNTMTCLAQFCIIWDGKIHGSTSSQAEH